ncbi:MAG TPA: hypothetical protein VE548_02135 [Nitrososphaeraceae archaeon]|nr:hypothetical protein [Nitrososphaeraceae archaeon]
MMIFSVCSSGLAIVAAAVLITTDQSSILFGQKTYPTVESGQRILLDTKSGLNKNLTIDEVQLMGPVLLILKADISQDKDFMLLGYNNNSISLYQYQSMFPIDEGVPMNLTRLADFDTIQDVMAEANGIKDVMMNKPWK